MSEQDSVRDGQEEPARPAAEPEPPSPTAHGIPASSRPRIHPGFGLRLGTVLGVFAALIVFPPVRYTLMSQFEVALSGAAVPFVRALDVQVKDTETARLDSVTASNADDYLIQVGRATALAAEGGVRRTGAEIRSDSESDHTLFRLGAVTRLFPLQAGAYAHLARYMMVNRIRIRRSELGGSGAEARTVTPMRRDIELIEWAMRSGEQRDPENAFWPAMLAATYFAAERDDEGLAELAVAAHRPRWDAYIYEEVLGQWRLYSAAYGDNGAAQQIGPLSLVAFPHLREMRRMAEMVRWRAECAAAEGRTADALTMRRHLIWLGIRMRDTAQWAYEALIGTDIVFIASTDGTAQITQNTIRTPEQWRSNSVDFRALLAAGRRDALWIEEEVSECCALRQRVDVARIDSSYPGIPPGIPLPALFGNWMAGMCLIQQMLSFALAALAACAALRWGPRASPGIRRLLFGVLAIVTAVSLRLLLVEASSLGPALTVEIGIALLAIIAIDWAACARRRPLIEFEERWANGTTARLTLCLILPGAVLLLSARDTLSAQHPVAVLLAAIMGVSRVENPRDALGQALLASGCALAGILLIACWAAYRRVRPLRAVLLGIRRVAIPAIATLVVVYIATLNATLRLDASASRAISEAAQNDLQWVLTHSSGV